jgi:hypothetical protein
MRSASTEPTSGGQSPETSIAETTLASDVEARLRALGPRLGDHDMLVLPPYQRSGVSLYDLDDVEAIRLARDAGLDAAFLDGPEDRRYLQEYSAGAVINFAIAFGANITSQGLAPLVNYVIARAKQAVARGLHSGPVEEVPVSLEIASFSRTSDGTFNLTGLKLHGPPPVVAEALRGLLDPGPQVIAGAPDDLPKGSSEDAG